MKRVSLADVARAAGVGKATASRALSERSQDVGAATRARIQEIAADLGYRPSKVAQALRTGQLNLIAVVLPPVDWAWGPVLRGATEQAQRQGYQLLVRPADGVGGPVVSAEVAGFSIDGIVVINPRQVPRQREGGALPAVLVGEDLVDPDSTIVRTANWDAGYQAGRHLVEQGCTAVLVLAPAAGRDGASSRAAGCAAALTAAGLPTGPELVVPVPDDRPEPVADAIGRGVEFDGVFGCTDELAVGALRSLRQAGRTVPDDVAVVAFGDESVARLSEPRLTVVRRPTLELGARAIELVIRAIEGQAEPPEAHELPARLVVGSSTCRR